MKTALVTGGTRGIGKEIALELAKLNMNIAINYNSNEEKAKEVVEEIKALGVDCIAVKADISKKEDVDNMLMEIEKNLSTVDILVNNAGITRDNLLIRMSEDDWDDVINTNLKGVFLCSQKVAKAMMKKRYGKIINIASVVGVNGNPGQANYAAAKAGVIGFTKTMAKELASRGVRVNAIAPGFIETDMTNKLKEEIVSEIVKNIPLGVFGSAKDVADLAAFLASEKADYITGQVIKVDGGMSI